MMEFREAFHLFDKDGDGEFCIIQVVSSGCPSVPKQPAWGTTHPSMIAVDFEMLLFWAFFWVRRR